MQCNFSKTNVYNTNLNVTRSFVVLSHSLNATNIFYRNATTLLLLRDVILRRREMRRNRNKQNKSLRNCVSYWSPPKRLSQLKWNFLYAFWECNVLGHSFNTCEQLMAFCRTNFMMHVANCICWKMTTIVIFYLQMQHGVPLLILFANYSPYYWQHVFHYKLLFNEQK